MTSRAEKRKRRRRSRNVVGSLMLIPLIDIITNILLFLLVNYSVEGQILTVDSKFKLPVSASREVPKMSLIVQVTEHDLIFDGFRIAGVNEIMTSRDMQIPPLYNGLNENTKKIEYISKSNPAVRFTGEVIIQGDKRIPFAVLEKIMYTCGQAGYSNISLAVFSRE